MEDLNSSSNNAMNSMPCADPGSNSLLDDRFQDPPPSSPSSPAGDPIEDPEEAAAAEASSSSTSDRLVPTPIASIIKVGRKNR